MYTSENLMKAMGPIPGKYSQGEKSVCNLRGFMEPVKPHHRPTHPSQLRIPRPDNLCELCQSQCPKVLRLLENHMEENSYRALISIISHTDQFDGGGIVHN